MNRSHAAVVGVLTLVEILVLAPRSALADPGRSGPTAPAWYDDPEAYVPAAWAAAATPGPPPPPEKGTYSAHIVLADVGSVAILALGTQVQNAQLMNLGFAGYFFGAPVIHRLHGRTQTAFASFGTRTLLPLGLALAGAGFSHLAAPTGSEGSGSCHEGPCIGPGGEAALLGALIGIVAAPILDASVLARTEWFDALPVVPSATVSATGGTVSLSGAF